MGNRYVRNRNHEQASIDIDSVLDEINFNEEVATDVEPNGKRIIRKKDIEKYKTRIQAEENRQDSSDEQYLKQCTNFGKEEESSYSDMKRTIIRNTELNNENSDNSNISTNDSYIKLLNKTLNNLEELYGLRKMVGGMPLGDMEIEKVHKELLPRINKNNKEINGKAGKYIVELSYLGDRLEFFEYDKVDFGRYKFLETILPILFIFISADRVKHLGTPNNPKYISKIFVVLKHAELENSKYRKALGYRLLRLFAIMIYHNNIVDAGILAKFILLQMAMAEVKGADKTKNRNNLRKEMYNNDGPVNHNSSYSSNRTIQRDLNRNNQDKNNSNRYQNSNRRNERILVRNHTRMSAF